MPTGVYPRASAAERFWKSVIRSDGCWLWTASTANRGYGVFYLNRRLIGAHRAAWILTYGAIPPGRWVLHRCDNPPCVKPDHLFLGDRPLNVQDMHAKQRWSRVGILSREDAYKVRELAMAGQMTQREIGELFGITQSDVSYIKSGKTWK